MEFYNTEIAKNPAVELVWFPREDENAAEDWAAEEKFPWPAIRGKSLDKVEAVSKHAGNAVPNYVLVDAKNEVLATGASRCMSKIRQLGGS